MTCATEFIAKHFLEEHCSLEHFQEDTEPPWLFPKTFSLSPILGCGSASLPTALSDPLTGDFPQTYVFLPDISSNTNTVDIEPIQTESTSSGEALVRHLSSGYRHFLQAPTISAPAKVSNAEDYTMDPTQSPTHQMSQHPTEATDALSAQSTSAITTVSCKVALWILDNNRLVLCVIPPASYKIIQWTRLLRDLH